MSRFTLDIILCCSYLAMVWVIWRGKRKNNGQKGDSDDDGGIQNPKEPILDLPPGVIWPKDKPVKERELVEN